MAGPADAAAAPWQRVGACAVDGDALLPDLAPLAAIAPHWRDLARALLARGVPADLSSPARLLALVVTAMTRPEIGQAFADCAMADVLDAIGRRRARLAAADQPWADLLRPADVAGEAIVLALPPQRAGAPPARDAVTLRLSEHGTAPMRCETGARWPFAGDGVAPGLLRLCVAGTPMIAEEEAPFAARVEVELFFRPEDATDSVAAALLRCLPVLPDPFDLASIQRAGVLAGLAGVVLRLDSRRVSLHALDDGTLRFAGDDAADPAGAWRALATGGPFEPERASGGSPMDPTFSVFIIVGRPRHAVFEAVADPAQLSRYFTTGGAEGRLATGATVMWDFHDHPGAFPVDVVEAVPDERIVLDWQANEPDSDYRVRVTMRFAEVGADRTRVEIEESGWHDTDAGRRASYGNCMGWSQMLAALKAWVEHGINLRKGAYA